MGEEIRGEALRKGKGRRNLLIIRNWLTGLQTYKVPRSVVGKLDWCKFQSKSHQGQNLQRVDFPVPVRRQEKANIPAQDSGEKEFPLTQPFCSVQVFNWMRPIHTGENNLLYSAYQLKC